MTDFNNGTGGKAVAHLGCTGDQENIEMENKSVTLDHNGCSGDDITIQEDAEMLEDMEGGSMKADIQGNICNQNNIDEKVACETVDQDHRHDEEIIEASEDVGMLEDTQETSKATFKERLIHDISFRRKFVLWICLCFSACIMGWVIGQLGPSLLDLKEITGTRLDEASFFLTSTFIGYLIGTTIAGAIYERTNPFLLLFMGLLVLGVTSGVIPWCSLYGVMIFMHILKGIGFGVLDTAANSVFMVKFKDEKRIQSYMQTIHLMFAVGGFLSPIATAPFLMQNTVEKGIVKDTDILTNYSDIHYNNTFQFNGTTNDTLKTFSVSYNSSYVIENVNNTAHGRQRQSVLYQAYLISTAWCLLLGIPFLIMFYQNRGIKYKNPPAKTNPKKLPLVLKCFVLGLMCLFIGIDNGMEDTYFGLFSTFIVKQLGWTKANGSYVLSVYWASFACGRLSAIFIGPKYKPSILLRFYVILFILGKLGLFLSASFEFDVGIWICFPLMGFAVSVFFPSIFLWTEAEFMPVAGRVASLLMVCASLGSMINPILIGYLMDNFDTMWFMYITSADGLALLVILVIAIYLSRYVRKYYRTDINVTVEPELNDKLNMNVEQKPI